MKTTLFRTCRYAALRRTLAGFLAVLATGIFTLTASADDHFITLASTTSTENSGLFAYILPKFTERTGIEVRVVAVGTGAALRLGERGDVDVILVHARAAEESFVAAGYGVKRHAVMYNDFVVVGPQADPAGVRDLIDAPAALRKIAEAQAAFFSRGDDSGTHKAELRLWDAADVDPKEGSGHWYFETGSGMGATLNTTAAKNGYALADRGTWLSFGNRGDLVVLVEGDPRLFNPYGVILVNPERHTHEKAEPGQAFIDWLISREGQAAIAEFEINGEQLFIPDAGGGGGQSWLADEQKFVLFFATVPIPDRS